MATNEIDYYYDRKMATFYDYSTFMRQFSDIAEGSANQSAQSINARIDSQTSHIDSAKYAIVASNEEVKDTLLELKSSVGTGLANVANKFDSTNQTVGTGFNRVSNQLGQIGVLMHIGLARTESAINQLSGDVRERLDALIDIETHPLRTQVSELYDRALRHFRNGWYDDSLESIQKSLKKDKTVYLSWFLMGRIYAFGNAINLDEAIIAFNNAIKYITPYIKNSTEIRNIASEIWFWFGVTQYTKSNDCLHNGNNNEALNFLAQARKSFEQSYVYSGRMLESLYNGARCDTLLENKEQALAELEAVIRKDKNYAIKVFDDSDFDSIQADIQKLIKKLRHEAYLQVKPKYDKAVELYDSAMNIGASCSKKHPNQFEEDAITYFEMLDYNNSSVLNNWQKEYENAIDRQRELIARREREEQERQRREQEQQRREQEQQRREQQRLAGFEKLKALEGTADFETNLKSDGTVTIRRYKGKNINIVIPSTIGSMRVTALEGHKIFGDDVRSVVIPYSVRRIDKGALGNTRGYASLPKLRKITIGANVSIEWSANDDNLFGKCYLNNNRESGTYVLKLRDGRRYWKKKKEKKEKGKKKSNSDAITVFIASLAVFAANAVYLLYFGIQSSLSFFITLSGVPFVTALIGSLYMKEKVGIINFIVLCIAQVIEIMVIVKVNMDNLSDFAVPFTVILFSTCGVSMAIGGFIGRKYLQILN